MNVPAPTWSAREDILLAPISFKTSSVKFNPAVGAATDPAS